MPTRQSQACIKSLQLSRDTPGRTAGPDMGTATERRSLTAELRQCALGLGRQAGKSRRIIHRQVGQNLAVEFYSSFLQPMNELVVAHSIQLGSGADAHDPHRAELPLALLASGIGKL